jgi:hypothetical protein
VHTLTVPADIVVGAEAASIITSARVNYTVTAQDDVDGAATLEGDGSTVTQDNVGGSTTISCDPASGSVLFIAITNVEIIQGIYLLSLRVSQTSDLPYFSQPNSICRFI